MLPSITTDKDKGRLTDSFNAAVTDTANKTFGKYHLVKYHLVLGHT